MPPKRPQQLPKPQPLTDDLINQACYVGSPEHKTERWWGGLPKTYKNKNGEPYRINKSRTTICPLVTETQRNEATHWVREALRLGQVDKIPNDGIYPRRLWYQTPDGKIWYGRAINSTKGEYKGWPISKDEKNEIFN